MLKLNCLTSSKSPSKYNGVPAPRHPRLVESRRAMAAMTDDCERDVSPEVISWPSRNKDTKLCSRDIATWCQKPSVSLGADMLERMALPRPVLTKTTNRPDINRKSNAADPAL
jgi:hypothetical protein